MHRLQRGDAPACLSYYRHGQNQWSMNSPTPSERGEIHAALENMQGRRCAYCECDLDQHGHHIDHYRQRARFPRDTFTWDNLFWSCDRRDSCGKHKDHCGPYDDADLIKPDIEDPELYFIFVSDGSIRLRSGLSPQEVHRSRETLRILNLDEQWGPLRKLRSLAVSGYLSTLQELQEMAKLFPRDEISAFINTECAYTQQLPFCTAIKHTLTIW